jgi:hypothetical protein
MKKFFSTFFLFVTLFYSSWVNAPKTQAAAPLVLGIIGTALGGSALGLGLYNTYQIRKLKHGYYNDYEYYDDYDYDYAPVSYSSNSYRCAPQSNYYEDEYYDNGYEYY